MVKKAPPTGPKVEPDDQLLADLRDGFAVARADGKDPLAVLLGRRGGLKGGRARANALSAEERSAIARAAARKRWGGDQ